MAHEDLKLIVAKLNNIRDEHHALAGKATYAEERERLTRMKELRAMLSAAICGDAQPCPRCGGEPHGIMHEAELRRRVVELFEIGCLGCRHHAAEGVTLEIARNNWDVGVLEYGDVQDGPEPILPDSWIDPVARGRS